ncbi:zinc ribbon domain-containing protein [Paenibacillus sp. KQZ6P-2]|uniref:Zinc ribbon domain-containing protein n=1 Tax=Paenibacillus mangrovi TaxID=2931978 RepID=A0A9X2B596_9BACL|nr:zinc ribbon domain-containing protein [Paenibacillus mangrovi]MCJ8012437.1 zinc ribbon domain-containing protein [Paenibacillus mangrovi]
MSNFLNKLKQGVSDAGKKAQQTVESTTLKFQVSSKEKDIEKNYTEIGRIVYHSLETQSSFIPNAEFQKYREAILGLEQEIEELNKKIQHLQNLKECGCGKMLPADATYCPFCGQQFQTVVVQPTAVHTSQAAFCPRCGEPSGQGDHFCRGCGFQLSE